MKKRLVVAMLVGGLMAMMTSGIAVAKQDPYKAACKSGGWKDLVDAKGTAFKSQGKCVSFAAKVPDACTELNKPRYDGVYAEQVVTLSFSGDEKVTFYGDYSAYCPGPDGGIGAGYSFTDGWGSSGIWNCLFYDSAMVSTGALPGTYELTWFALGNMEVEPVWTVTCTHEY